MKFEEDFHLEAIPALASNIGYVETWDDRLETTSAPLDSIGMAQSLACFVEVKTKVDSSVVRAFDRKIRSALTDYNNGRPHPMIRAMKQVWPNPVLKPIVAIIAYKYGRNSVGALTLLLRERAVEWGLYWGVYELSLSGEFRVIDQDICWDGGIRDPNAEVARVAGPKSTRSPLPLLEKYRAIAAAEGVSTLFDSTVAVANSLGLDPAPQQNFLTFRKSGKAAARLYVESGDLLLAVPKELTETMIRIGFERHPTNGRFRWPRFRMRSSSDAELFTKTAIS